MAAPLGAARIMGPSCGGMSHDELCHVTPDFLIVVGVIARSGATAQGPPQNNQIWLFGSGP